jgi:DNA-binding FadR family transcriptional regulator
MPHTRVPRTIHRQVVEALAHRIVSGRVAPGDPMPTETELCSELGVSRTILREAMKFLAAKGMVEIRPKIGTRVRTPERWNLLDADVIGWRAEMGPDDQLIRDLIDLRQLIEPPAAERAARRAGAEDIVAMEAAYARMAESLADGGDYKDYIAADLAFHRAILDACNNQLLSQLATPIGAVLKVSFSLSARRRPAAVQSLPGHRAVLDAIKARNPARARAALETIIANAAREIEASYGKERAPKRAAR